LPKRTKLKHTEIEKKKKKKEIENDTLRNAQKKQYRKKIRHEPHKGPISEIMST
jgi:hypothetical protein